jgi:hypothetical protein
MELEPGLTARFLSADCQKPRTFATSSPLSIVLPLGSRSVEPANGSADLQGQEASIIALDGPIKDRLGWE